MTSGTLAFLLYCAGRLLAICSNTTVIDVTLGSNHYSLTILSAAITFLIFNVSIGILSIPIRKAMKDAWGDDL